MAVFGVLAVAWYLTRPTRDLSDAPGTANESEPQFAAVSPVEVLGVPEQIPQSALELKDEATQACDRLIADLPNSPEALAVKAVTFMRLGQTSVASRCWEEALERNRDFSPAYLGLGTIAFQRGDYPSAISRLRHALELNPRLETAHSQLVQALLHEGDVATARNVADEFARQFPNDSNSSYWRGQAYLQFGDFETARRCHEQAIQRAPDLSRSYYSLAVACARLGQKEQAGVYRAKFVELSKRELDEERRQVRNHEDAAYVQEIAANVYRSVGDVYSAAGAARKAEASWLRGAAIAPDQVSCYQALTTLYMSLGRWAEAARVAEQMIALGPEQADIFTQAGLAFAKAGNWDAARRAFRTALARDPQSSEARLGLVALHLESGQPLADVAELAEEAVALAPSPRSFVMLSAVCEERRDLPGARRALQQALKLEPENRQLRDAYDRLVETRR